MRYWKRGSSKHCLSQSHAPAERPLPTHSLSASLQSHSSGALGSGQCWRVLAAE